MNAFPGAAGPRRAPMDRQRYRRAARQTGIKTRLPRRLVLIDLALLAVAFFFMLLAGPRIGGAMSTGFDEFGGQLGALFPSAEGSKAIDLPPTAGNVSAQLPADNVPDFVRDPDLKLTGRVPAFAMVAGRNVAVKLNGVVTAIVPPDAAGAFAAAVTLKDGPNAIELALISGTDVVANSAYTVVLDRQPPTLAVTRPANGDSVEAPTVSVQGKAETGATISVNDRMVIPAPDGSFSDSFTASAGPLTITVVARDRAGNETTVKNQITVKPATTSADLVLFSIFGGTALLLYGVRLVGEGLQRAAGTRLRHLLSTLTGNRFKALLVGAGVTAVLQSSSATTVMLVGFASAGLLTL